MNQNKKKVILYFGFILLCIFFFIVTFKITVIKLNNKPNNDNENIIEYEEQEEKEDDNILKVIIDKNETEEENELEETNKIEENDTAKENNVNSQENKTVTSKAVYYIKVNNKANTVTIYKKDAEGKYTIPAKAMICSIGDYTPPCTKYPNISYVTNGDKYKWATLEGHVYGQYATRIVGGILFHSVPYSDGWKNAAKGSLEYWEYDKLGTKASLGCVRLSVADAKWIYDNIGKGTTVEFYSDDNPGPLGKPTAKKISDYADYLRGWDPTDPDKNNPWITYVEPVNTKPVQNSKNIEDESAQTKIQNNKENENTNKKDIEQNLETNKVQQNNTVKNESTSQSTKNTLQNNNQTQNDISNVVSNNTISNTITNNTVSNNTSSQNTTVTNYTNTE